MSDLVERLRRPLLTLANNAEADAERKEAADEIEAMRKERLEYHDHDQRQEAEIERLRERQARQPNETTVQAMLEAERMRERERCAQVAEDWGLGRVNQTVKDYPATCAAAIAYAIRALKDET